MRIAKMSRKAGNINFKLWVRLLAVLTTSGCAMGGGTSGTGLPWGTRSEATAPMTDTARVVEERQSFDAQSLDKQFVGVLRSVSQMPIVDAQVVIRGEFGTLSGWTDRHGRFDLRGQDGRGKPYQSRKEARQGELSKQGEARDSAIDQVLRIEVEVKAKIGSASAELNVSRAEEVTELEILILQDGRLKVKDISY